MPRAPSLDTCRKFGVSPTNLTDHFHLVFEMPDEILQLTQPFRHTPNTPASQALRAEVAELNTFFANHTLEGARHIGWVRMFHMARSRAYAWNKGERVYSQPTMPATNYQQMSQEQRLELRLGGKQVAEIDISASYLTVFSMLAMANKSTRPQPTPMSLVRTNYTGRL